MQLIKRISSLFPLHQANAATRINTTVAAIANHVLTRHNWAREQLSLYPNYLLSVHISSLQLGFILQKGGVLRACSIETDQRADAFAKANVTITLSLGTLCKALMPGSSGFADLPGIDIQGDAQCAQALSTVLKQVRWDIEEDLSTMIGDILAHRVVRQIQTRKIWIQQQAKRFMESAADYHLDEHPSMVRHSALNHFTSTLPPLQDAAQSLEKRIAQLERLARHQKTA